MSIVNVVATTCLVGLLAFGFVGRPAAGGDGPTRITVETLDGKTTQVEVLGIEGKRARLKIFIFEGEATILRNLSEYTPESAFLIEKAAAEPVSFEEHFALAKRAGELSLIPQAGSSARLAIKVAATGPDGEAKKKQVHAWAADVLERVIREAVAAGDLDQASNGLEILTTRLPEQRTEEQLEKLAEEVATLRESVQAKEATEREAQLDEKLRADLAKKLEPIKKKSASGDKKLTKAMAQSNSTSASARGCDSAVDDYKAAWKLTQELLKAHADDDVVQTSLAPITDHLLASALRAAMHAASVLTLQSDYKGAMSWVDRVLKFDPGNSEAESMKRTIEAASAEAGDRDDYRYAWTGRPRATPYRRR
jgi:hypothetical protein